MNSVLELKEKFGSLERQGVEKAEFDWILSYVTGKTRSEVRTMTEVSPVQRKKILDIFSKRSTGRPLDQIIGVTNFYGFDFFVDKNCLIPRSETELLCETVIREAKGSGLDIGTGSGAIAIILDLRGGFEMTGSDISGKAIAIAKKNKKKLKSSVKFVKSDLFLGIKEKFNFIVSNPPYIRSGDMVGLQREVHFEPKIALDGGNDGLDFYRKIIADAPRFLKTKGMIFFEIGINQAKDICNLLDKDFENIKIRKDFGNIERIVYATKK